MNGDFLDWCKDAIVFSVIAGMCVWFVIALLEVLS